MPYLHWDTDKGRIQLAKVIEKASQPPQRRPLNERQESDEDCLRREMKDQNRAHLHLSTLVNEAIARKKGGLPKNSRPLPPALQRTTRRGILGQLLLRAAALSEILTCYEDEELVREFISANPPLHPRRTLHQSSETHYGFLKSTDRLDKEQVVYKATAPAEQSMHRHCTQLYSCLQCMRDIQKVPRVLMVDQLWLFILDNSECPLSKAVVTSSEHYFIE
jgi:hypothetical protein